MSRTGTVVSHWHALVDGFNTSPLDFYTSVEGTVKEREVPDAKFSRVEFKEGGLGSANRVYLRIQRKNLAFDICAAPYGKGFFFSWWLSNLGPEHPILMLLGVLIGLGLGSLILALPFSRSCGYVLMVPIMGILLAIGLALLASYGVFGPEERILGIPVIGLLYERIFNPITYYSIDTAMMYQESVRRAVNEVIESLLKGQGLRVLSEDQLKPTIRDLAG